MHLPGPLRAAVGLVATAASEARHLPDRAVELPMLAVSSALQASLRAQQRYARLAARGDEVLNRRVPTEEPPPWATFDDPVPLDNLRRSTGSGEAGTGSMFGQLFGVEDPTAPVDGREPVGEILPADEPVPAPAPAPAKTPTKTAAKKAAKKVAKKAATRSAGKTTTPKSAGKTTAGKPAKGIHRETSKPAKKAARKAAARAADTAGGSKTISKPRHTAPSAFDNVDD